MSFDFEKNQGLYMATALLGALISTIGGWLPSIIAVPLAIAAILVLWFKAGLRCFPDVSEIIITVAIISAVILGTITLFHIHFLLGLLATGYAYFRYYGQTGSLRLFK